jgi:hypothetical protein
VAGQQTVTLWTAEQVARLKRWQACPYVHPYTCPGRDDEVCETRELTPTLNGWVCACGKYTQRWAHLPMLDTEPPARIDLIWPASTP